MLKVLSLSVGLVLPGHGSLKSRICRTAMFHEMAQLEKRIRQKRVTPSTATSNCAGLTRGPRRGGDGDQLKSQTEALSAERDQTFEHTKVLESQIETLKLHGKAPSCALFSVIALSVCCCDRSSKRQQYINGERLGRRRRPTSRRGLRLRALSGPPPRDGC